MTASIATVTGGQTPFTLSFYIRLHSMSSSYIALDSIHLVDCYQGGSVCIFIHSFIHLYSFKNSCQNVTKQREI